MSEPLVTTNDHRLITIAGSLGSGKTALARAMAARYESMGHAALALSSGEIYRALGWVTFTLFAARQGYSPTPAQVVAEAARRGLKLVDGRVCVDRVPLESSLLDHPTVTAMASYQGGIIECHAYVSEVLRTQIADFPGFVILDGRSVNYEFAASLRLYLTVSPQEAARRKGISVTDVLARDRYDKSYPPEACPLRRTEGEIELDTDGRTPEQVLEAAMEAATILVRP